MNQDTKKILILIVAYHAERHIVKVFERIPKEVLNSDRVHVLCLDDASKDESASVASQWVKNANLKNVTVLRNSVNQGYGGNQKLGYRFAIDFGFDFVIMLHGDGQYAPELLPLFIQRWEEHDADVLLGSRMQSLKSARTGGMPIYKMIGNRALTIFQNAMTGQHLSEYHTGYRGYSTRFLGSVPFEINTNLFHFDTEILLQAFHARAKVVEFPIPTHYGDEVCHVDGLKYAKDVVKSTLQYRFHSMGMFCSLKYQNCGESIYGSKVEQRYSSHAKVLELVKKHSPRTIADIGCGPGFIAQGCRKLGAEVVGIDANTPMHLSAMKQFFACDLDRDALPIDIFNFDTILMLDVIEHLSNPESFLLSLRNNSKKQDRSTQAPLVIVTTPNIAFFGIRLNLLLGRFNYAERGILDITHKRLFTIASLRRTLEDCGFDVMGWKWIGPPFELVIPGKIGTALSWLSDKLAKLWPSLFAFQMLAICRPRPGVRQLLHASEHYAIPDDSVRAKLT